MPRHRETREYEPKPMLYLTLDMITLLPAYEIYWLLRSASRLSVDNAILRKLLKVPSTFRVYRVYSYFAKLTHNAGINQILIVFSGHCLKLIIITHVIAAIWYYLSCWKCQDVKNWTENIKDYHFDSNNPVHWLIICFTTINNIFANNWRGKIINLNIIIIYVYIKEQINLFIKPIDCDKLHQFTSFLNRFR